jgi:hypothetical protein
MFQAIDLGVGPEEVEVLTFPAGSVLRLHRIRHSAIYTCRVANGDRRTDTQVAYGDRRRGYKYTGSQLRQAYGLH